MNKYKNLLPVYLKGLVAGKYTLAQAAGACGYSLNHMWYLKTQYKKYGFSVLDNKNRGRIPANKTPDSLKNKIMAIYAKPEYSGINFKYFCECLNNYEDIKISYSNLLNIKETEIIYTSGASESNNTALKGIALKYKNRGKI